MDRGPLSSRIEPAAKPLRLHVAPKARVRERTSILVRGLEVQADIGVNADEIGRRQPLIIHGELELRGTGSDRLDATFDYCQLVDEAKALANQRIALIETFARRLAHACMDHPAVVRAEITVEKPEALADGLAGTRVLLERD
jgi:dihydroneopterin aldolase